MYCHKHSLPKRFLGRDPHPAVNIRRIRIGSPVKLLRFLIEAVHQDLHLRTDSGRIVLIHDSGLQFLNNANAFRGSVRIHMLHSGGRCSLFRRKHEGANPLHSGFLQKVQQLLKFFLSLSRQAGNQACADDKPGDPISKLCQQVTQERTVPSPVHPLQNFIVTVLNGNVQILDNLRLLCNYIDQFIVDFIRINVMNPNPVQSFNPAQTAKKFRQKTLVLGKIHSVAAGVLRNDNQFFHALCRKGFCLSDHIFHFPGAVLSPQIGNDTECAAIVAALSNFDKRIMGRCGKNTSHLLLRCVD